MHQGDPRQLEALRRQRQIRAEAGRRLARMTETGLAILAEEVFDYLSAWARGERLPDPPRAPFRNRPLI
jgi:hypothetical protein